MNETPREWTVQARCPHGYPVSLGFDALGYLTKPPEDTCPEHKQPKVELNERAVKRELRRFRREMRRNGH